MLESPFVSATKGRELIPQPHGGALSRGGRKPGAKNKNKPLLARVQAAAGRKSMAAVARLAAIMADPDVPPAVAVQAARVLLAYGVGRPPPMGRSGARGGRRPSGSRRGFSASRNPNPANERPRQGSLSPARLHRERANHSGEDILRTRPGTGAGRASYDVRAN